jgi:hypothetical protein
VRQYQGVGSAPRPLIGSLSDMVIGCKAQTDLDYDALVAELRQAFPASTMISDDYYANRLAREIEISRKHGWPLDSKPLECTRRVAAEHGTQRHLCVRVSKSLAFDARIDRKGGLFVTHDSRCIADAKPVLEIIRQYPVTIETC